LIFIQAAVGAAIGLGNIWKFPYLTFKHGGWQFIVAYLFALFVVGFPMLILELTLGQKMQRGSAGAQRGILPRLAGSGWAASIAGFITCIIYNILLGMVLLYMVKGNSQPWKNYERPLGCKTAAMMNAPNTEIYMFMNVTKLFGEDSCAPF
jgi:SNF family Na+-dependent transporter